MTTTSYAPAITKAAQLLNASPDKVVAGYRDAAYSLAAAFGYNRLELIKFVRECIQVRYPDVRGRQQFDLAVEILIHERIY
jgi:hypothetical protein